MRFALTPEQKKFFVRRGYIVFEEIPTTKEREIAQLVSELTDLKPLRIAEKRTLPSCPMAPTPFGDQDCALLQSLKHGWTLIFNHAFPRIEKTFAAYDGEFLYIHFTRRFLDPEKYPVIYG